MRQGTVNVVNEARKLRGANGIMADIGRYNIGGKLDDDGRFRLFTH